MFICVEDNCDNKANFESDNLFYCNNHKKDKYKTYNKICNELGCKIRPKFNYKNCSTGLYCKSHKLDNMINIYTNKNSINKKEFQSKIEQENGFISKKKILNITGNNNINNSSINNSTIINNTINNHQIIKDSDNLYKINQSNMIYGFITNKYILNAFNIEPRNINGNYYILTYKDMKNFNEIILVYEHCQKEINAVYKNDILVYSNLINGLRNKVYDYFYSNNKKILFDILNLNSINNFLK